MLKKLNNLWVKLIGSPLNFRLESRIFHSISVCLFMLAFVYIPYNFFAGMYVASVSAFFLSSFFGYQYYNSRVNGVAHSSWVFGITGLVVFSVNYFSNSGIHGSTDVIWPAYLLLLFTITPYRQHVFWLVTYIVCFLALHLVAYYHPLWVKHPFSPGAGELIDRITAFPLPVITVYIIIKYIRKSYDREKTLVEEKAVAIDRQNQQILLQSEQLAISNAEKNKLMSIISHDMRAPLISIKGYLELLSEIEVDAPQRSVLENELLINTNNTLDMLTNLLQWSKSQMEGPAVNLTNLNLADCVNSTLLMGKTQAAKKGIAFNYDIPPAIMVYADVDMLQLVVRNLVSNAIKFTPPGGMIEVEARLIADECKITVKDNGKGIATQKQEKIFSINTEPGFGTNNEKGVGLGLLLCKEFIERQHGRIGFESVFGQGSSFFIFIPQRQAVNTRSN